MDMDHMVIEICVSR